MDTIFLGGLITIIAASKKISVQYGALVTPILTLILSLLWVFSALAIIKSTWSWVETIKVLEDSQELKFAWKTFEDSKRKWKMGEELRGTFFLSSALNPRKQDRILKVTYNLVRIGYFVIGVSIILIIVSIIPRKKNEVAQLNGIVDSLKLEIAITKMNGKTFISMLEKTTLENEAATQEIKRSKTKIDSLSSEVDKLKRPTTSPGK